MYEQATALAKNAFEQYLLGVGVSCTWKHRSSAVPTSVSNDVTQFTGRYDPQDSSYVGEHSNTTLYPTAGQKTILVAKDLPNKTQAEDAGQMVTASTTGYTSLDNVVTVGDYLLFGSEVWCVSGARAVSPAIYRELTLEKRA